MQYGNVLEKESVKLVCGGIDIDTIRFMGAYLKEVHLQSTTTSAFVAIDVVIASTTFYVFVLGE